MSDRQSLQAISLRPLRGSRTVAGIAKDCPGAAEADTDTLLWRFVNGLTWLPVQASPLHIVHLHCQSGSLWVSDKFTLKSLMHISAFVF